MPSTPQLKHSKSSEDSSSRDHSKLIRPETFLCRVKYENNLPDLPFDPKFRNQPVDSSRFVEYAPTSLERNHKLELLVESNVGVDVDLINQDLMVSNSESETLHPTDALLLEDDIPSAIANRSSRHQQSVSWLRKTEYISTEFYNSQFNKGDKVESKLGYNLKRVKEEENVYRDREGQIKAIEATFEASKKPILKHYSKPGVEAVEVIPLLPDFRLWKYPCAQVIFDDNPARKNLSKEEQSEEVTQAMIRGMVDETGDQFVAYFLPTEETKKRRSVDTTGGLLYTDGEEYEYELAREYNWNVKNKTMSNYEENYFLVFRQDGVYYNELETRVRLSKRRKINQNVDSNSFWPNKTNAPSATNKTRLIVTHRDFTEDDLQAQKTRMYMLEHEIEEEEEEIDDQVSPGKNNFDASQDGEDENDQASHESKEDINEKNEKVNSNEEENEDQSNSDSDIS